MVAATINTVEGVDEIPIEVRKEQMAQLDEEAPPKRPKDRLPRQLK
jgi:hypothetical protein